MKKPGFKFLISRVPNFRRLVLNSSESSGLLVNEENIGVVLPEVFEGLSGPTIRLLHDFGVFEKVLGFMCEAWSADQPASILTATLISCDPETVLAMQKAARQQTYVDLSEDDLTALAKMASDYIARYNPEPWKSVG